VHCGMLTALEEHLEPPRIVVVRGEPERLDEWAALLHHAVDPHLSGFAIADDVEGLPPAIALKESRDEGPVAYVCQGLQCDAPVVDIARFSELVGRQPGQPRKEMTER